MHTPFPVILVENKLDFGVLENKKNQFIGCVSLYRLD
jgi:hypothetical protein